jgi:hypothetical protein
MSIILIDGIFRRNLKIPCTDPTVFSESKRFSTTLDKYPVIWEKFESYTTSGVFRFSRSTALSGNTLAYLIPDNYKPNCYEGQVIVGIDITSGNEKWRIEDDRTTFLYPVLDGFLLGRQESVDYLTTEGITIWSVNSVNARNLGNLVGETLDFWIFIDYHRQNWQLNKETGYITPYQFDEGSLKAIYLNKIIFIDEFNKLIYAKDDEKTSLGNVTQGEYDEVYSYSYLDDNTAILLIRTGNDIGYARGYDLLTSQSIWSETKLTSKFDVFAVSSMYLAYIYENNIRVRNRMTGVVVANIPLYLDGNIFPLGDYVSWIDVIDNIILVRFNSPRIILAINITQ